MAAPQGLRKGGSGWVSAAHEITAMADMLCAQPRRSCWCPQRNFEADMGLKEDAVTAFFQSMGNGKCNKTKWHHVGVRLERAGVFRRAGSTKPRRVWWLAFTGEGGTAPIFSERGADNSFVQEGHGATEEINGDTGTCGTEGVVGGSASPIIECAAAETTLDTGDSVVGADGGGFSASGTDQANQRMREKVDCVRTDALQMLISTSTHGAYLNLHELSRFLDLPAGDLRSVLTPRTNRGVPDRDVFLQSFGVLKGTHCGHHCWQLLGCGHLLTLEYGECMRILSARPQPTYWNAMP